MHAQLLRRVPPLCALALLSTIQMPGCNNPGGGGSNDGPFTLTVVVSPSGAGQVSADPQASTYADGSVVTLTASAAAGYRFDHWSDGTCGSDNPCELTMTANVSMEAVFVVDEIETEVADNAKVLPDTVDVTTSGENELTLSGDGVPDLHPGDIIVAASNGGLLARVRSVHDEGGAVTLETEPAALTDVIKSGRIQIDSQPSMAKARMRVPAGRQLAGKFSFDDGTLSLTDLEIELADKATITLDGSFSFEPGFEFDLIVEDWRIDRFLCAASGDVNVSLDATVEATAVTNYLEAEQTLVTFSWPEPAGVVMVGPVPVVYDFYLKIVVGAGVSAGDLGTLSGGLDLSAGLRVGAEYSRTDGVGRWFPIASSSFDADAGIDDWSLRPVSAEIFIKPEFGIRFYKIVGPSLSYKEYLELEGDYRFDALGAELRNGHVLDLNFKLDILDRLKFSYTHNLYEDVDVLMAHLAFAADPTDLGTIDYAPSGLAGFYWHTLSVTAEGDPQPGYELAGYSIRHLLSSESRIEKTTVLEDEPVDASKLITAHFVPEGEGDDWSGSGISGSEGSYAVDVSVFPPGAGRVVLFPTLDLYHSGDKVLVQAIAEEGFTLHHWVGDVESETDPVTTLTVRGNTTLLAVFESDPPRVLDVPGEYDTIQDAINAATYNDIIELSAGTFTGPGNRDLEFEDTYAGNITIRGQGCGETIIDLEGSADEPHRLAIVRGQEEPLHFEGLTVRNGYVNTAAVEEVASGGVFFVPDSRSAIGDGLTSLEIADCCFEDCTAEGEGDVLFFGDPRDGQHLYVKSSSFSGCGGENVVHIEAAYEDLTVRFESCTFADNAGTGLDASPLNGDMIAYDTIFTGHLRSAAVLANAEDVTFLGCTFTDNASTTSGGGYNGGALQANESTVVVQSCIFAGNTAPEPNYGGAIWGRGPVTLADCTFTGNFANIGGAVALTTDEGVMRNCTFDSNDAENNGGAAYLAGHACDCAFTNNTSGNDGGAVYLYGGVLEGSTLTGNIAGLWGGAVSSGFEGGSVSGCTIESNRAGGGGGVDIEHGEIRGCTIADNEAAEHDGGGIKASYTTIYGCTVRNNRALQFKGGGIEGLDCLIASCVIEGNSANQEGGGLTLHGSTLNACTITGNTASEGGAVKCWDDDTELYGCTINGNTPDACSGCDGCSP